MIPLQAVIGIAFSCGFLLGPVIGAVFSVWGKSVAEAGGDPFTVFQYPALFSLTLALLDIALLVFAFPETLPTEKRARAMGQGMLSTLYLINPLSIFRFDAISKIAKKGVGVWVWVEHCIANYNFFPLDLWYLRLLGLGYFLYLFLFSGLEYSLTFLTHQRFKYTRYLPPSSNTSLVYTFCRMDQGMMFLFMGFVMILVQGLRHTRMYTQLDTRLLWACVQVVTYVEDRLVQRRRHLY